MNWKALLALPLLGTTLALPAALPARANDGLYYFSKVSGDVRVKKSFFSGYQRASSGQVLSRNDRIWVKNGRAVVICNNLKPWPVPVGKPVRVSSGCPATTATLRRRNDNQAPPRGNEEEGPILLSPRNTALLPIDPITFRWQPVEGASRYQFALKRLASVIWSTETAKTQVPYPGQPPLTPNRSYFIAIAADNGKVTPEDAQPTLTILSAPQAAALQKQEQQVEVLNLEPDAKALTLAYLYRSTCLDAMTPSTCLNQAAIDVLAERIEAGSQDAAIYQLQANTYQQIGLQQKAEALYQKALTQAQTSEHLWQQAEIQQQLGLIARQRGNHAEAVKWLQSAKATYQQLVDPDEAEAQEILQQLQDWLEDSQRQSTSATD